jgi:hypothetical protein
MIRDDHRKPLAHYGAPQGRARSRLAPPSYTTSRDATCLSVGSSFLGAAKTHYRQLQCQSSPHCGGSN